MKRYILITANGLEKLEKYVNEAYRNGYVALGGPLRTFNGEYGDTWFAQAMVLA